MKAYMSILALFSTYALALPDGHNWKLQQTGGLNHDTATLGALEVRDEAFGDRVFHGSPKAIYEEMKALKPEIFLDEIHDDIEERSLEARRGNISCNWDSPTTELNCQEGIEYLRKLGNRWCGVNPSPANARVSCSNGCGIILYNKKHQHHNVRCKSLAKDAETMIDHCKVAGKVNALMEFKTHSVRVTSQSC